MSLVAVYDALKEAKVSDHKAAAAVEALESSQERYGELRADMIRMQGETNERMTALQADTNERIADLRGEMARMQADTNERIADLRGEMDKRFAEMDVRIGKIEADIVLLKWMFGFILASLVGILLDGIFG